MLANDPDEVAKRSATSTPSSATCAASSPRTGRPSAPPPTGWPRSPTRSTTASTTSSRRCTSRPTVLQNFINIYQPAQSAITGLLGAQQLRQPVTFICGAIQAASRLGAEQSSKLCVQYLAPIIKNRQYNFPPLGENLFVGASARPNEVTYSEDWLRPDYVPPTAAATSASAPPPGLPPRAPGAPPASAACDATDPAARPGRHDGAAGGWLMRRGGLRAVSSARWSSWSWPPAVRLRMAGPEFAAAAGHRRAAARAPTRSRRSCPTSATIQQNSRVRVGDVDRRQRHQYRAPGLACAGDDAAQRRCRSAGQRHRQDRPDQPAGFAAHRTGPAHGVPPQGKLHDGSLIPLSAGGTYPTDRADAGRALAAAQRRRPRPDSGHHRGVQHRLLAGREQDLRSLITQLDKFIANLNDQTDDIIAATESLNNLVGQFADQQPVSTRRSRPSPTRLRCSRTSGSKLADALDQLGQVQRAGRRLRQPDQGALWSRSSKTSRPVLESLANAGPALTRSLSFLATYPLPKETITKLVPRRLRQPHRDHRPDAEPARRGLFTGTRWEGNLTELEMQWGRTIGQMPSPYTAGNPLVAALPPRIRGR